MMKRWIWWLGGVVWLSMLGCATTGDLKKLRRDHMALQARFDAAHTKQTRLALQLRSVARRLNKLDNIFNQFRKQGRYNFANFGTKLDELRTRHQELLGKFQLLKLEFDKLKKQITQPGAAGAATKQMLTPEATFKLAQQLYAQQKYDQVILHLKNLIKLHPNHSLSDDAYILLGDCYIAKGNPYEAIIWFNDVRKKFPSGDQVATAFLKLGVAHFKIGACPEGRAFLRRVLRKYRSSAQAPKARDMLRDWRSLCKKR